MKSKKPKKKNKTFRLPIAVVKKFKEACKRKGVSNSAIIEDLMLVFILEMKRGKKSVTLNQCPAKSTSPT